MAKQRTNRERDLLYVEEVMLGQLENQLSGVERALQRRDMAAYRRAIAYVKSTLTDIDDIVENRRSLHE